MVKKPRFRDYHEKLLEDLLDIDEAKAYIAESIKDPNPHVFLLAVKNIYQARWRDLDILQYKGYLGYIQYDLEASEYHGVVIGITDVITFKGKTTLEAEEAFHNSVDDYIRFKRITD